MRTYALSASTGESIHLLFPSPAHLIMFSQHPSFCFPILLKLELQRVGRMASLPFLPTILLLASWEPVTLGTTPTTNRDCGSHTSLSTGTPTINSLTPVNSRDGLGSPTFTSSGEPEPLPWLRSTKTQAAFSPRRALLTAACHRRPYT